MTDPKKPVSEQSCEKRHRFIRYAGAVIATALCAGIVLPLMSASASRESEKASVAASREAEKASVSASLAATKAVKEVAGDLHTHIEVQAEHDKHIGETLDRIESSQVEILKAIGGGE